MGKVSETTTTEDVAVMVGVSLPTLKRWLKRRAVPKPQKIVVGKRFFWRWTEKDVENLRYWKCGHYKREIERRPRRPNWAGHYIGPLSRESRQAWIKFLNAGSSKEADHWRKVATETQLSSTKPGFPAIPPTFDEMVKELMSKKEG